MLGEQSGPAWCCSVTVNVPVSGSSSVVPGAPFGAGEDEIVLPAVRWYAVLTVGLGVGVNVGEGQSGTQPHGPPTSPAPVQCPKTNSPLGHWNGARPHRLPSQMSLQPSAERVGVMVGVVVGVHVMAPHDGGVGEGGGVKVGVPSTKQLQSASQNP